MSTTLIKNTVLAQAEDNFKPDFFGATIDAIRKKSFEKLNTIGFPTKKTEDYRYLPIEKVMANEFSRNSTTVSKTDNGALTTTFKKVVDVQIINGIISSENEIDTKEYYIANLALAAKKFPAIFEANFLKSTAESDDAFALLNNITVTNGLFIYIKKNAVVEDPICISHIINSNSVFINQRNLIVVEENAQCSVFENYESLCTEKSFYNTVTEVFVSKNANYEHINFQSNTNHLILINNQETHQESNSVANNFTFTVNGTLTRNNTNVRLNNEHIESHLFGVYIANGESIIDNHTLVDHRFPNCNSNELYKGVANEKAVTVFNGKIYVRKDAQKTNAFQSNKNILLSNDATINTKPQLEIYADDVKCSHGTSTGKLDENALFYLKARGISEQSAKKLLLQAFVNEACEEIKQEDVKEYILNILHDSII